RVRPAAGYHPMITPRGIPMASASATPVASEERLIIKFPMICPVAMSSQAAATTLVNGGSQGNCNTRPAASQSTSPPMMERALHDSLRPAARWDGRGRASDLIASRRGNRIDVHRPQLPPKIRLQVDELPGGFHLVRAGPGQRDLDDLAHPARPRR